MSKIDAVLITINTLSRIPFLNIAGPILSPLSVTRGTAENLKKLGFPVEYHDTRVITESPTLTVLDTVTLDEETNLEEEVVDESVSANPNSSPDLLTSQEPIEVSSEKGYLEDVVEEETTEEEVVEEETTELEVFTIGHYKSWTIKKLVSYLQKASDYLEDEEVASLESLSKTKLLDLIEKRLISAAE